MHARCVRHVDVGQVAHIVLLDEAPEGRVRRAERDGVLVRGRGRVRMRVMVGVRGRGRSRIGFGVAARGRVGVGVRARARVRLSAKASQSIHKIEEPRRSEREAWYSAAMGRTCG